MTAPEPADQAPRRRLTPQQQAAAMAIATSISVLYIHLTSRYWDLPGLPSGLWITYWVFTVAVVVVISFPQLVKSTVNFVDGYVGDEGDESNSDDTVDLTGRMKKVYVSATIIYALAMIAILSWATLPTGGSIYSPYSQLLFAAALLAPYIAKRNSTGLGMGIVAVAGFYICHFVVEPSNPPEIPEEAVFFTTAAATLTSAGVGASTPLLKRLGAALKRIKV